MEDIYLTGGVYKRRLSNDKLESTRRAFIRQEMLFEMGHQLAQ